MANRIESFQAMVIRHLLGVLGEHGRSFLAILTESQNCDPAFLLSVLREMEARKLISVNGEGSDREYRLAPRIGTPIHICRRLLGPTWFEDEENPRRVILDSGYFRDLVNAVSNSLPEPGLVYSQWWFSEPTYRRLTGLMLHMMRKRGRVAFLGASTLGAVFSQCGDSPTTIIDVDEVLLKRVRNTVGESTELVCRDIADPLDSYLQGKFDIVFADPPWSSSILKTFFVRSSEMLAAGGTLVISFPPMLTRPSIRTERTRLLRIAEQLGLSFTTELRGFTEYRVPSFEYRAYEKYGIDLDRPWRQGDVLIFRRCAKATVPADISAEPCGRWDQYDYGAVRLFLKQNGADGDGPARIAPVSGSSNFAYSSTSSRTQLWKYARLVSTRNQVADVSGAKQLASILQRLAVGTSRLYNDPGCFRDALPETRAVISMFLGESANEKCQEGERKCRERKLHVS
jgi:hypothetical protein